MDPVARYIAYLHQMLGHDKAAAVIGQPPGNRAECLLCQYESNPGAERKQAVVDAIGTGDATLRPVP
jgi:hypothetical protein